ncbi:hypothetical protein GU926_18075 [Nibribacter ruber]|uniref:Uncharacterized protein n=1 Tax=Nibribacter ruber TaxID=2698458 RepID=A0A6P1P4E9_9BACT|nr:hypothetical protein [Nibribacter ruber]QHL89235.1 hypothetical protein GU926_18075 [Nibribacter ruber]
MAQFHHTFSDPFSSEEVDLGYVDGGQLKQVFREFAWEEWLQKMEDSAIDDFHFSPTLNVFQKEQKREMLLSALKDKGKLIFYVSYRRPQKVKRLFGLMERFEEKYTTEVLDQTKEQAAQLLQAFIEGDAAYLNEKVK